MTSKTDDQSFFGSIDPEFPNSTLIAISGGVISALGTALIYFGLQRIFQHLKAHEMLDAIHGTANSLCFAGVTASATIMPLMLTIFSFARRSDEEFNSWFYGRIKRIALLCCVSFVTGLFTLTILSSPIGDMPEVNDVWFDIIYYIVVAGLTLMVGSLIIILILLYYSILHVINELNPHKMPEE